MEVTKGTYDFKHKAQIERNFVCLPGLSIVSIVLNFKVIVSYFLALQISTKYDALKRKEKLVKSPNYNCID